MERTTIMTRRTCLMKTRKLNWSDECIIMMSQNKLRTTSRCLRISNASEQHWPRALALRVPQKNQVQALLTCALPTCMSHLSPTQTQARLPPCKGNSLLKPPQQRKPRKHHPSNEAFWTNSLELISLNQQRRRTSHLRTDQRRIMTLRLISMLKSLQR